MDGLALRTMRHDAFISYSHAADSVLAEALQRGLSRLAKPWHRRRALNVFRDATNLGASPSLWASIESALAESRWLLLMASPESAASPWVQREVRWWLGHCSPRQLLIVLTAGGLAWRADAQRFDAERSPALPPELHDSLAAEPLYVDLRWARAAPASALQGARFRAAVLDIASPLHGRAKDELDGADLREHRRTLRLAVGGAAALGLTTVGAVLSGWFALSQRDEARAQAESALSGRLAAQVQVSQDLSATLIERNTLLAAQAVRRAPSSEAIDALRAGLQLMPLPLGRIVHSRAPRSVSTSADGARVAVAADLDLPRSTMAAVYDSATGRELLRVVETRPIERVWLTPDGNHLLLHMHAEEDRLGHRTGGDELAVWQVAAKKELRRLPAGPALGAMATSLVDPSLVALASESELAVVRLDDGRRLARLAPDAAIVALAFAPSGQLVALDRRGRLVRWDWAAGARAQVAPSPVADARDAALSEDGTVLAWREPGGGLRRMALDPRAHARGDVARLAEHAAGNATPSLVPAGSWLASLGRDGTARVWDAGRGREVARFTDHDLTAFALSADSRALVVGGTGDSGWALESVPALQPAGPWTALALADLDNQPSMVDTTWVLRLGRRGRARRCEAAWTACAAAP